MDISVLERLRHGLIVSCQALEDEPLHGARIMARMALAASMGGAAGIRCNGIEDIRAIRQTISLPTIGIIKKKYADSPVYITPSMEEVALLVASGTDIIAVDATDRVHPGGKTGWEFVEEIKNQYPDILLMADISNKDEAVLADQAGADIISTTLSGYTGNIPVPSEPDFELIRLLAGKIKGKLFAEGRLTTPEKAVKALALGAYAVVVGGAITRPQLITKSYADKIKNWNEDVSGSV